MVLHVWHECLSTTARDVVLRYRVVAVLLTMVNGINCTGCFWFSTCLEETCDVLKRMSHENWLHGRKNSGSIYLQHLECFKRDPTTAKHERRSCKLVRSSLLGKIWRWVSAEKKRLFVPNVVEISSRTHRISFQTVLCQNTNFH